MMIILRMAWRNLWRNRRRTLLTATTISLGLILLLVTLGLGDGSHQQMIDSAVRSGSGHVVIEAIGYQELGGIERTLSSSQRDAVTAWLEQARDRLSIQQVIPRIWASLLGSSADGSAGLLLLATSPEEEVQSSRFAENLTEGEFLTSEDSGLVLVGVGVARKLKIGLDDKMVLMGQGATGEIESIVVRIKGLIRTGLDEFDQSLVLADLPTAQQFLALGGSIHQITVLLDDVDQSTLLKKEAAAAFPDLEILDWSEALPVLADFIRLDDAGGYVFHMFIFLLIAFMVLNTLLMSVLERGREFSLLDALGLVSAQRFLLVLVEGILIAALAALAGLTLGLSLHWYLAVRGLPMDLFNMGEATLVGVAFDPIIYSNLSLNRILQAVVVVFGMNSGLAMLAARRAARPADIRLLGSQ